MENKSNSLNRIKRHQREKVLRFSIRKYSFGAASVAVAALMFLGARVASADSVIENHSQPTTDVVNQKEKDKPLVEIQQPTDNKVEVAQNPSEKELVTNIESVVKVIDKAKLRKVVEELKTTLSSKSDLDKSVISPIKDRVQKGQVLLDSDTATQKDVDELLSLLESDLTVLSNATKESSTVQETATENQTEIKDNKTASELSEADKTISDKKESLKLSADQLQAAVLELPEHESTKEVFEKANELLGLAQGVIQNTTISLNDVEDVTKRVKRMFNSVKNATTRLTSGARDSRNGKSMGEGTQFRATTTDDGRVEGALTNVKEYISEARGQGSTTIGSRDRTISKTFMTAKYSEENGSKFIIYDVYFQNDGRALDGATRNALWFYPPRDILYSDGSYPKGPVYEAYYERYRNNTGTGTLSHNPNNFTKVGGTYNVPLRNGQYEDSGSQRLWGESYSYFQMTAGPTRDNQRQEMLKHLKDNPELNSIIKQNNSYPGASYSHLLSIGANVNYAYKYHVKLRLKNNVTADEAKRAGVMAVTTKSGLASNATAAYVYAATGSRLVSKPDAQVYPIQGSTHTKVVGDTILNSGNPVADRYITRKGSGDFPGGMSWSWEGNNSPSTANAGKFTYTAIARYQDGSTSKDANSGSDGRVHFTVNPKKPTITTSVVNKKGLTNQTIEVNVGSGVKNGSVVKLYDGDRVIGQGTSNGTTARITVSGALPGNPLKAETTVDNGGVVVSQKSDPVTPTEAPDTQAPTLAITPANQTVVEGQTVTFTVTARDDKHVNLDANEFLTKYGTRVFSGKASITSPTDTDTEKTRRITITTTAEDVGKTNTITFNATDNANHRATPVTFTFTVTSRDTIAPTITAGDATVTSREQITPISVTAVDNTGGVGMRDNNPIEVTGLPAGLTYANNRITGTPTGAPGNSTVTIKAYDKNGNMATKTITITVRSQADTHNPTGAGLTVNQNHTITDAELKAKVSNYAPGTLSIVSRPSTATAGNAGNAVVKVTYPDGTFDNVNVPVTVTDVIGPTITANNATVTNREPITPIPVTAVDNTGGVGMRQNKPIEVTGLPAGLTYANNQITGTPTGAPGNSTVTIKAYDRNNTPTTKTITITVRSQADVHNPTGAGLTVNQNHTITDAELKAKVSNAGPGNLSIVSRPSTATAGNAGNAVVKVTYLDGTFDNVNVPVTVTDVTGPTITAESATVTKNESITPIPVTAVDNTGGVGMRDNNPIEVTNLPAGLRYANNQITGTPTAGVGYYTVTIKAYDKNNRLTTKQIRITVRSQADAHNPTGAGLTVNQNHTITDAELKAKVSNAGPGTLSIVSKPSTATAGNAGNAVVKVTYPDGTFDNVNVPVTVTDVTGPTITAESATVTKNEPITPIPVTAVDNTGGVGMRDNNPIEVTNLPTGLRYANNQITGTPTAGVGYYTVTIKAYDKNNRLTTKQIRITVRSQADAHNPTGETLTVPYNHNITDDEVKAKVQNFAPGTLTVQSKPSTNTSGNVGNAVVKVTYPDGSHDTVNVPVVVGRPNKDDYTPKYNDGSGKPGSSVEIPVSEANGKKIPTGTTYTSGTPGIITVDKTTGKVTVTIPSDKNPGDKVTGKVLVRYPDGSEEEVPVTVTVVNRDKDDYTPKYNDGSGKPGSSVEIPVSEANGKKIPTGTTYTSSTPGIITVDKTTGKVTVTIPSDKNPGDKVTGKVLVRYPDGSTEEVPVTVTVTPPEKLTPTVDVEQDPKTGDVTVTPKKPDGSIYPPGTKVEIPGKDGNPITVTIGEDGKGKVPNSELPDGKVPGTGKITEPGKPAVEVPNVTTPAKVTPATPETEKPGKIEITQQPNGNAIVTPKKPDGSTYPPKTTVEIPGENGTTITVTIGDNGSGEVPNDNLPKTNVSGTGKVTEPNKKPSQPVDVTTPARKTPTVELKPDPKTGDVTVTPKKPDGSTFPPGTTVEIPGENGPITVEIGQDGKGKIPNDKLPKKDVPGTGKITEPGKPAVEVPNVTTPAKVTPETPETEKPGKIEITQQPNGNAIVTPKKPDGSTYPPGTTVEIPGENGTTITVTIGDNGSGEVPNDKLPKGNVPGKGTVTEPNKKPSQPVDVTTPARKTPTIDVERDPKTGDVTVTPKKPDGSTYPPGTTVEIPGENGPITVTIGENGKGKVPNDNLPKKEVPGTGKITEPGKPTVEVPNVTTPGKFTPETPVTEQPGEIEITRKPNGDAVVTPKKPDGSTYPPGTTVEIPGEDGTTITVTIGDNGSGEVPNDNLPKGNVPGKGTVTEPNKKPSQPVDVTTPARKTPTLDVEQDPKTGDVTVTPKKPDGSTYPPGTKVEIPGKDGNTITVTIGEDGKGKVPNSELPEGKVPGTGKITEPGKPAVEVPVTTPAKVRPNTPTNAQVDNGNNRGKTEKVSEIKKDTKRLANTGTTETNTGLAGLGLGILGGLLAAARRRKNDKN